MEQEKLENRMRFAEQVLEDAGAAALDINRKNRELLGQRVTYQLNGIFYRIDHTEYDGETFIILSATEDEKLAGIGLMEDIQAVSAGADDKTIRKKIREALS